MVPKAAVTHHMKNRMRLKIESRRGDASYFSSLADKISEAFPAWSVAANTITGSLLVEGDALDLEALSKLCKNENIFTIEAGHCDDRGIAPSVVAPLYSANRQIKEISGGRVDLPAALFISLLLFGLVELIRGKWKTPPWYTAFWYAFGLYSKSLIDQPFDSADVDPDGD
jgi:hypothetical protein